MLAKVLSGVNVGLEAVPVTVEVDVASQGLPAFTVVGLGDRALDEARERVRSALRNSGADFPPKRITVNLAPADLPKEGSSFDLAIALGLLAGSGQLDADLSCTFSAGELSLDGSLRYTNGILPLALLAKKLNIPRIFVPQANAMEAAVVTGVDVFAFGTLKEVVLFLSGQLTKDPCKKTNLDFGTNRKFEYDFSQIKGQEQARRALEIAAAGGHNVLMKGPPGAGKTLLARSFPSILPPLSLDEALEVTQIYSITGNLQKDCPVVRVRPFRAPHHTASYVGMIGGGNHIKPGEVSLAHRGALFLDELPEFGRQVLEALRQPLEDRKVSISRSSGSATFPAQFILIAALNPCPCGFLGSTRKACVCLPAHVARYKKKLSGPLLDRIDICLDVPFVEVDKLTGEMQAENSDAIRGRVEHARVLQRGRFESSGILTNAEMNNAQVKKYCKAAVDATALLKTAVERMKLSARAYYRVLKLSRTVADLANSKVIQVPHLAESLQYRLREE